jgi:hypothetical protein
MKKIKIQKLPTYGSALSIKTIKQGRRISLDRTLGGSDLVKKKFKKSKENVESILKETYEDCLEEMMVKYKGKDRFIDSIRSQIQSKGINNLTRRQRCVAVKVLGALLKAEEKKINKPT